MKISNLGFSSKMEGDLVNFNYNLNKYNNEKKQ